MGYLFAIRLDVKPFLTQGISRLSDSTTKKRSDMEKVLVTTDLSVNSLAGLRFAIQLATQRNLELLFLHVSELWW